MEFFISEETVKYDHPDEQGTWVEINAELSGHEERQRDALAQQTQARMERDFNSDEIKEARERAKRRGRIRSEDEEDEDVSGLNMDVTVSTIKAELDMFDLEHYVKGWSLPKLPNRSSFRQLTREAFNWLLTVIDEHRFKTVLSEDDEKNSPQSSGTTSPTSASPGSSQTTKKTEDPQS